MISKFVLYILIPLYILPVFCIAQEMLDMEEMLIEQLTEISAEEVDLSEVVDRLWAYKKKPLNLNTVHAEQLADLIFLSPQQIRSILNHRILTGAFLSVLELQSIPELNDRTIQLLKLFVEVRPPAIWKDLDVNTAWKSVEQAILIKYGRVLEQQAGYAVKDPTRSHYLGDPNRYAVRYKLNYEDKIRIAWNMEKDAGEPFFQEKQSSGFDFYSGHILFKHVNRSVKQVVIGDYILQFGQGLILWNGLSFGKGAWAGGIAKEGRGLQPYSSMGENRFQRGIAGTIGVGSWEITPFVSYNKLSGNIEQNGDGEPVITSINYSGLHRTPTEQANRRSIKQFNYGTDLSYRRDRLKLGLTYLSTSFVHTLMSGKALYQQFDFEGNHLQQLGIHYNYTFKNVYLFGEMAKRVGGGMALNQGMLASLHPQLSAVVHYRNYSRDYDAPYARATGEGSHVKNEKGFYAGLTYHPNRRFEYAVYVDAFRFPWLRYRVDGPSSGVDFLTQLTYTWYKRGRLKLRYRHRVRQENALLSGRHENLLANVLHHQLRLEFQYKLNEVWRIRNRAEWTRYDKEDVEQGDGGLIYQDVFWKGYGGKLQANTRLAFFHTKGYNARIYAYENNVLYTSGFPVYYDKGIRTYLNLRWRVSRGVDFWARYARTIYNNKESVGSGLDKIPGNSKSDITLQLRWQW